MMPRRASADRRAGSGSVSSVASISRSTCAWIAAMFAPGEVLTPRVAVAIVAPSQGKSSKSLDVYGEGAPPPESPERDHESGRTGTQARAGCAGWFCPGRDKSGKNFTAGETAHTRYGAIA